MELMFFGMGEGYLILDRLGSADVQLRAN